MDTPFVLDPLCSFSSALQRAMLVRSSTRGRGSYARKLSVVAFPYVRIRVNVFVSQQPYCASTLLPHEVSERKRHGIEREREREPGLEAARFLSSSFSFSFSLGRS